MNTGIVERKGIEHYTTRGHASFSEVAIKTFKKMLYDRVEANEKGVKQI